MRKRRRWTRNCWTPCAPPCRRGITPARQRAPAAPPCGENWRGRPPAARESLHTFRYFGVPDTYQILIATAGGDTYLFPPCTRTALQSSVTVDWADKSVEVPPAWIGYVLQFLCTLLPTLVIEGVVLVLFGFSWKQNRKPFLLVNLVTQGALAVYFSVTAVQSGVGWWYFFLLVPAEIVIAFVEGGLYTRLLTGSRRRAFAYGITANLCSALLGLLTVEPLWRWIVSIS